MSVVGPKVEWFRYQIIRRPQSSSYNRPAKIQQTTKLAARFWLLDFGYSMLTACGWVVAQQFLYLAAQCCDFLHFLAAQNLIFFWLLDHRANSLSSQQSLAARSVMIYLFIGEGTLDIMRRRSAGPLAAL